MDIIEVNAHFDQEGRITPITFIWEGRSYRVEGTGRKWEAKDGFHILVMIPGDRVFHLIFYRETGIWKLFHNSRSSNVPKA